MAITRDRIFAVADEISVAGCSPTLASVRKALGGGSYTTISEAMGEWKVRKAAQADAPREPVPATVSERLAEAGAEIWALALALAQTRLATDREALEETRIQLETEKAEAMALADQLTGEAEALQERGVQLEAELAAASQGNATMREQWLRSSERAAMAEARAEELSKRAEDLNAELARVNGHNAELVKALAGATRARAKV